MSRGGAVSEKKSPTVYEIFTKALCKNSEWSDKDELLDVIYWGRQISSLLIGICWGLIPLKGLIAIIIYIGISTLIAQVYLTSYQCQDVDNFGGFWEVAKEGFGAAFATFMISWITVYSAIHFNTEM